MDFEVAAFQAAQQVFRNSQLYGCLFHFVRNMKKQLQTVSGALQRYRNYADFALNCRTVTVTAFVPINRIDEALQTLERQLPQDVEFLLDWIEDYYVGELHTCKVNQTNAENL